MPQPTTLSINPFLPNRTGTCPLPIHPLSAPAPTPTTGPKVVHSPMTRHDAVSLIDTPWFHNETNPMRWADLGCGSGTFTLALADLLPPGSSIEAIDLRPSIAPQTTKNGVTIYPRAADFTTLEFAPPTGTSAPAAPIPDRLWPGTQPLQYHGILMANSLHYVQDQKAFLTRLKTGPLLLIEYDTDIPVARWVPYPLSFANAAHLLQSTGRPRIKKLGTLPSAFGRTHLYAALALPAE